MKVFIIGSVGESENNIALVAGEFRNLGCDVRYVYKQEKPFAKLVDAAFAIIDSWADVVVVVPKTITYTSAVKVGEGTTYEIEYAKKCGKPVLVYTNV
ncbi:hypothetical protein [Frisingicoccus sp.]|uniref:hypothetical protein n=1 Tax=Frisingicoccus sp. TaxID=1918627 RepID=UPI00399C46C1